MSMKRRLLVRFQVKKRELSKRESSWLRDCRVKSTTSWVNIRSLIIEWHSRKWVWKNIWEESCIKSINWKSSLSSLTTRIACSSLVAGQEIKIMKSKLLMLQLLHCLLLDPHQRSEYPGLCHLIILKCMYQICLLQTEAEWIQFVHLVIKENQAQGKKKF